MTCFWLRVSFFLVALRVEVFFRIEGRNIDSFSPSFIGMCYIGFSIVGRSNFEALCC